MAEIKLESKLVNEVNGNFFVPSYQRGYRWGGDEVLRLLDDVFSLLDSDNSMAKNYCLQPVVVKNNSDSFELIDGQQRLTTLYLIYQYMNKASNGFIEAPKFSIMYETRSKSAAFLEHIDMSLREDNIDFWFMANAYETIEKWFEGKGDKSVIMMDMKTLLAKKVKIIWYEVDGAEDTIALFTRLNIGKIPLTSAELVKAMFLSRDNNHNMEKEKQEEIALQWDNIEKELHNDSLWYFLTNNVNIAYQTRIDLILDLICHKSAGTMDKGSSMEKKPSMEKYDTFFFFDQLRKERDLKGIWQEILHTFLILKDWYGNHELYHKIGYLIASRTRWFLPEIYEASKGKTKREFLETLDKMVKESIAIDENYADLSYEKSGDYAKISRLLLLFNVESVRRNGEQTEWFPFHRFKFREKGKVSWSLEHIHAQQSQGMKKQEEWKEWLRLHIRSIQSLEGDNEELLGEMKAKYNQPKLEGQEFVRLQEKVIARLSVQGNVEYMHSIANLALLNSSDNAALNNSTFDVKRNEIIEMDKKGQFIPFCTKMAFLKYYTSSEDNQVHFWGQADRIAYVQAINEVLADYLEEPITVEQAAAEEDES